MDETRLRTLLAQVRDGILTEEQALAQLRMFPYEDLEYARLDTHRALRTGMPETVYSQGRLRPRLRELSRAWPSTTAMCWPRARARNRPKSSWPGCPPRPTTRSRGRLRSALPPRHPADPVFFC